ncbi:HAD family hydrolase [Streptosporangium amethystogenes]|uniref:HAD family hydrolase n=1 Tax=Streptosporangium amethystogenes TaxID=2002 RepID=UPI000A029669|nr:HAD family hydrolase [Streptosporangium amethystogenes]
MQRLALFDLDNTLVNLDEAFQVWAKEFVEEHDLESEAADWLLSLDRAGYPHREVFFTKVRDRFTLPESVDDLWSRYRQRMPYLVRCRPEVRYELSRLRASGWKVAIVTNGTADNQLGKIQRTGLAEVVDAYALSGLEGIRKPDVGLFEVAAQRCGVPLEGGGWMVGDHPVADISGGQAAGLRTVWIDRGMWPDHEYGADHVVTDVLQAMEILRTEGDRPGRPGNADTDLADEDANNRSGRSRTTMD